MKLRALKVHGFKSFADSTSIEFHDGITAIVGPNGCGKSNISDAIRWVLGEQRPTAIRGAKMEEAIFQGSVNRRPVNRGSVVMLVSNEDGALPVPFEEVEIGRQVFRDGGSEYSINRSACRLRDVVDLCRDTGLGANAYAVIENRMIDAILSDRAEERRGLFEEASGIGKYKDRRKAATRRLERAELDLQRLEDVISEVQTKVRSLARQKGKAERYLEYRKRRLDVEVAVVRRELEELAVRLGEVTRELEGDAHTGEGMVAELRTAEAEMETLRLREVDAQKERAAAGARLDEVRQELVTWERDLAVAEERAGYARSRLDRIGEERADATGQAERSRAEAEELEEEAVRREAELAELSAAVAEHREAAAEVRARLGDARSRLEAVESKERGLARRGAQLAGDAEAAEGQAAELERRLERLTEELETARAEASDVQTQGDLFSGRLTDLGAAVEAARGEERDAAAARTVAAEALEAARREERAAAARAASLEARIEGLGSLDDEDGGDVRGAAREAGGDDVLGSIEEFIDADPGTARAVEAWLGPLAGALVVRDRAAARRLAAWFADTWTGGGGLVLLPLDAAPGTPGLSGSLLQHVRTVGEGAPWARALLHGVELRDGAPEPGESAGGAWVTRDGALADARGVVRVGDASGAPGLLQRRERLEAMRRSLADTRDELAAAEAARTAAEAASREAEHRLEEARAGLRAAQDAHREAEAEMEARTHRRTRLDRHRDELARQVEGTRAARGRALERAREAREDREAVVEQEDALGEERQQARSALDAVQEEWETVRAEEARNAVDVARLEGDVARVRERLEAVRATATQAERRAEALDAEEERLRADLEATGRLREEGAAATERLFGERSTAEEAVRSAEAALQEIVDAVAAADRRVRELRTAERAATDRRHRLELEKQELRGRVERIRERLEAEWGRSLEALLEQAGPVEGETEALKEELRELVVGLEKIGPVNMLAVEEHAEESARLAFLTEQREDLARARDDLRSAIREINRTATELFMETFEEIRKNFRKTHLALFEGGEADIWLQDPDDPLESPIEIHASPRGKKTQRIDLLSGGERALTALSLLFGIYLVKPSPFCVLDEVDAPLDENNIGRFIRLLQEFAEDTQFVVITHNPRTIEAADWIYGVTMEEPGVSSIVGVRLQEALETVGVA